MAITTIFGINGVGKDTVANSLRTNNPDLLVTSISRMLMYILGITKTYDVNEKVCEEQYKMLESVPQEKMIKIENTDYKDIADLAQALIESKVKLADVGIKPVFRLHPPRKGYEDIRLSVKEGGSLGYRGENIKDLAKKML